MSCIQKSCAFLLCLFLGVFACFPMSAQTASRTAQKLTVYEQQPPVTEKELLNFLTLLPEFRLWAHDQKEEAHPMLSQGKPDFLYSGKAASWVTEHGWDVRRFFCIMGRMAAAVTIVAEGNDLRTRPSDMPNVTSEELELARIHMGAILKASGSGLTPPSLEH